MHQYSTHTHTHIHTHTHKQINKHTHINYLLVNIKCIHIAHTHTNKQIYKQTNKHTHKHTHKQTNIQTNKQTNTHTNTPGLIRSSSYMQPLYYTKKKGHLSTTQIFTTFLMAQLAHINRSDTAYITRTRETNMCGLTCDLATREKGSCRWVCTRMVWLGCVCVCLFLSFFLVLVLVLSIFICLAISLPLSLSIYLSVSVSLSLSRTHSLSHSLSLSLSSLSLSPSEELMKRGRREERGEKERRPETPHLCPLTMTAIAR